MNEKLDKGKNAEDYALQYLRKKGYSLVKRNFTSRYSEIDLIVRTDSVLVFCEVRVRKDATHGYPEDTLSQGKIKAIKRGAEEFLLKYEEMENIRFDMISIVEKPHLEIVHFEDVFY